MTSKIGRSIVTFVAVATIGGHVDMVQPVVHGATLAATGVVFSDGTGTRTTPTFSFAAGDLLAAFIASDGPSSSTQTVTAGGAGLTWTLVRRVNTQAGTSEIWKATAPAAASSAVVTSTQSVGGYYQSLTVVKFSGASGTGATGGANATTGAPSVSLTTTQAGSLVYGVGNDWDRAVARTLGAGQTMVHQYLAPVGDTFWVQNRTNAVAAAGTAIQLNDTAPTTDRWNFAAVEIVPATPAFEILAYNNPVTLGLSSSATYQLQISPLGDFTGSVFCTVSGLPTGTTGTFEPPNGPPHPGPFALVVNTSATTPPGTFQLTVTCANGALSASKTLTLIVTGAPDFKVTVEPNSLIVSQAQQGVANVQVEALNGFAQPVNLTAGGLPTGVSATFTPFSLIPTGAGTVQFTVGALTPPGVYPLTVTATGGSLTRQATFQLTVALANTAGSWRQLALGDTPTLYYGAIVGDVGNTGRNRVYGSGGEGVMYEYSFDGTAWSSSRLPVGVQGDVQMHNMDIGPARRDGINRLYIASAGGDRVYECSWINAWQCVTVTGLAGATDIIIGDGRNDAVTRMYVTWTAGVIELTWNGSGWSAVTLSNTEGGFVHGIDLGQGRNDGLNRLYTANQGNGEVYEYSWGGASWTKTPVGSTMDSRNIEVGQGRNDGTFRLYVPSGDSNLYEFTWTGSAWQKLSAGNAGVNGVKVQSIPARARSDNLVRIYCASGDAGVDEYTWTGTAWQTVRLGSATAYMYGLAAGDGLNNGTTQVYGSSYDGNAYLFEWVPAGPPPVMVPDVVGQTEANARTTITNSNLVVGSVGTASSQSVPAGSVISQSPAAGTLVAPGSTVHFVVSSGPPPPIPVPDVVGQTQAAATSAIVASGLTLGTVTNASSSTVPAGSVISQDPAATTPVPPGSAVNLVVSSGPPPITVPNVVGQTQAAATTALTDSGLTVGTVTNAPSATVPAGSVISQNPAAGTPVPPASAVSLVVSSGPVIVPNVVGLTQAAATAAITSSGLTLGSVTNASSSTVPAGSVISQNPAADTPVGPGSAVSLVVSSGPPPVPVPNVVGLTQEAATTAITNSGLTLGAVTNAFSSTVPAGSVISQNPTAGTPVPPASAVNLVVSSGPAPVTVPNVVGLTQAAATTAIVNSGLVLGTVGNSPSQTVPAGSVISQNPAAGTPVVSGSAVNIVVSSGPPLVTVPNVVGLTQAAATTAIVNSGLVVGTVSAASSQTVPAGSVISQTPTGGTVAPQGSAVNLVVSAGALAVDKVVFSDGSGTRVTPAFSTASTGELLLAFGSSDGPAGTAQSLTISGAGLTWTLVQRRNTQRGTSEIWRTMATNQLTNVTVTSTQAAGGHHQSLTVVTFIGAGGVGASAVASGASGAPSVSLTTTKAGSFVYGVGNDWDRAVARVLGPDQVMVHQWVDTAVRDTFWVQRRSGPIANSGTVVQINDTSPTNDRWNLASVEIVRK